jgi:urease accessory protein UreE
MAEKFLDKVGAALESAAKETEKAARIGKLKLDKLALERERDRLFTRMGKKAYRLMEEGKEVSSED